MPAQCAEARKLQMLTCGGWFGTSVNQYSGYDVNVLAGTYESADDQRRARGRWKRIR